MTRIFFVLLTIISSYFQNCLYAQTFEIGKNYVYRSALLSDDNTINQSLVLTIVFDAKNNATITRTIEKAQSSDGFNSFIAIPSAEAVHSDNDNFTEIKNLGTNAFFIPFETAPTPKDPEGMRIGGSINIHCSCMQKAGIDITYTGDGKCMPQTAIGRGELVVSCASQGCTGSCKQTTTIRSGFVKASGLVISAESVLIIDKF
jgi:hypothetical protein